MINSRCCVAGCWNRSGPHDPRRLRKARGGDDLCRSRPAIDAFHIPRTATALSAGPDAKWRNPLPPGPHPAPNAAPHMRGRSVTLQMGCVGGIWKPLLSEWTVEPAFICGAAQPLDCKIGTDLCSCPLAATLSNPSEPQTKSPASAGLFDLERAKGIEPSS